MKEDANMKAAKVTLIVLIAAAATLFVKAGRSVDLRRTLPFCDGAPPNKYHVTAIAILLLWLWGMWRLWRKDDDD